ncbi:NACHT, LRR and PYD domains-containing protein 12 [Basidiobolus ranarum]|uniref:NACHT, LRR and PYD domains-containing protein 12 n=1 Tax=Basidiobolus ranarum TaxID=34480 RepID=A0ABR2W075_9FUNG
MNARVPSLLCLTFQILATLPPGIIFHKIWPSLRRSWRQKLVLLLSPLQLLILDELLEIEDKKPASLKFHFSWPSLNQRDVSRSKEEYVERLWKYHWQEIVTLHQSQTQTGMCEQDNALEKIATVLLKSNQSQEKHGDKRPKTLSYSQKLCNLLQATGWIDVLRPVMALDSATPLDLVLTLILKNVRTLKLHHSFLSQVNLHPVLRKLVGVRHLEFHTLLTQPEIAQNVRLLFQNSNPEELTRVGFLFCKLYDGRIFRDIMESLAKLLDIPAKREFHLELVSTRINSPSIDALGNFLSRVSIQKLRLSSNDSSDQEIGYLIEKVICKSPQMTEIKLTDNEVGEMTLKVLGDLLSSPNCQIKTLDLANCDLDGYAIPQLTQSLSVNKSLRTLDISDSSLGSSGSQAFQKAFQLNRGIRCINLDHCQPGVDGSSCLLEGLLGCEKLEKISFLGNFINNEASFKALLCLLTQHPNLQHMSIDFCFSNATGFTLSDRLFMYLPLFTLTALSLPNSRLSDRAIEPLARQIQQHKVNILQLNLSNNHITDVGLELLSKALSSGPNCKHLVLNLSRNRITQSCMHPNIKLFDVNPARGRIRMTSHDGFDEW